MDRVHVGWVGVLPFLLAGSVWAEALRDIGEVPPDLTVPAMTDARPAAGLRVREMLPGRTGSNVYHAIHLPANWRAGGRYPVLMELAGNGHYSNKYGDVSAGRPEGSKLGYGLSAGHDFIWVCAPYLNGTGDDIAVTWWGSKPTYDPQPTLKYLGQLVDHVGRRYGGDTNRVVLCGFSRGAIACNFLGLHDDTIAGRWRGFIAYSHYDGVLNQWPYPGADRDSARKRLERLGTRPQFICGEGSVASVRAYLEAEKPGGNFTFATTGFRNHNDAWVLRPSETREKLRAWLRQVCDMSPP